jgi:hypothetical protein
MKKRRYKVTDAELLWAGINYSSYHHRRYMGETRREACRPADMRAAGVRAVEYVCYNDTMVVGLYYTLADHIAIRRLHKAGVSVTSLSRQFNHIPFNDLLELINGHNFLRINT